MILCLFLVVYDYLSLIVSRKSVYCNPNPLAILDAKWRCEDNDYDLKYD